MEGYDAAKTAEKEEMCKCQDKQQAVERYSSPNHETF